MSDDPREAQRKMDKVFLCNDIWWDCLPFLSRAKVGFEFALVSDRFDGLADAHLNSKKRPWTIGDLKIIRGNDQNEAIIYNLVTEKHLPLPEDLLPDNVIGFKRIYIRYIDHKVIDFLRRIRRLFEQSNDGNSIGLNHAVMRSYDLFFDAIWPLVNPFAITKLFLPWKSTFDEFRRRISPTFLTDWTNVRMLITQHFPFGNGEDVQLLRQWLYTPREDGKPKLLSIYCYGLNLQTVEQLKTEFLNAQNAVSFIIAFIDNALELFLPFELDNLRTGERLTLRNEYNYWLLERGPIGGRDAAQWAKWEEEAMDEELEKHNLLFFSILEKRIGPLDKTAGPSGQSQKK